MCLIYFVFYYCILVFLYVIKENYQIEFFNKIKNCIYDNKLKKKKNLKREFKEKKNIKKWMKGPLHQ